MNRNAGTIVLDLDGRMLAGSGSRLRTVPSLSEVPGDKWVISDFDGAEPAVITVEAKAAFAGSVAEQELRRSGEVETGGSFHPHRVRRRGDRASEVFGSIVPSGARIQQECEQDAEDSCVLGFPLHAAFVQALEALRPRRPVALLLVRDRQVDVIVGDRNRTYGAFRSVAPRGTDARDGMAGPVRVEIGRIARETGVEVAELHWGWVLADAAAKAPGWIDELAAELGVKARQLPTARIRVDDRSHWSVLPAMVRRLGGASSAASQAQVNLWRMNLVLPRVAMIMLVLTGLAAWSAWEDHSALQRLNAEIHFTEQSLSSAPRQVAEVDVGVYEERLDLAEALVKARSAPPLRDVVLDVASAAEGRDTYFNSMKVEYGLDSVMLTLGGQTNKRNGADPMPTYTAFMDALREKGYGLVDSDLNTGTAALSFSTRLEKGTDQ